MSAYWRNLMQRSPSGANVFGDPRVGLPAWQIPVENAILSGKAQQFPQDLHRAYVLTVNRVDVTFDETGYPSILAVQGTAQYYRNGVPEDIISFTIPVVFTTGGVNRAQMHALVHDIVTAVVRSPRSEVVPEAELEDEQ